MALLGGCDQRGRGHGSAGQGSHGLDTSVKSGSVKDTTVVKADTTIDVDTLKKTDNIKKKQEVEPKKTG